jgi:toxin ParE1/3/4
MNNQIDKTQRATADLRELRDYFRRKAGLEVAVKFIDHAETAFNQLAKMPGLGAKLGFKERRFADIRRWQIDGFDRLVIYYRETANGIQVVRVRDGGQAFATMFPGDPD